MRNPSYALKVVIGLLLTVVVATLGFVGTRFAQSAFDEHYRVWITLGETGQGVISGSDVVMRGVIVGEVGEIALDDELRAEVELVIQPDLAVPTDAVIAVTGKTLLGEKQVEIRVDGPLEGPFVADGGFVDDPDQVVELQDVLSELDVVLELTRPDLDRMIVEGDNVTRMLWTYRPELADLVVGLRDYTRIYAHEPLRDPGFSGNAVGFQILLANPLGEEFCGSLAGALRALVPICAEGPGHENPPAGPQPPELPDLALPDAPLPDVPLAEAPAGEGGRAIPLVEVPARVDARPEAPTARGLDAVLDGLLGG